MVESPNFGARLLRENARTLVVQYEYEAAAKILSSLPGASGEALGYVRAAAYRLNLDHKPELGQKFNAVELAYRPPNSLENQLAEYIWVMEVRYQQGHWAEFARLVTPALSKLIQLALRSYLSEAEWAVLDKEGRLENEVFRQVGDAEYLGPIARDVLAGRREVFFLSNNVLMGLLNAAWRNRDLRNQRLYQALRNLRRFESNCRNKIAHEIKLTSRQALENISGCTLSDVKGWLFQGYNELVDDNPIEPGMYDRINYLILKLI